MPGNIHNRLCKLERKVAPEEPRKLVKLIAEGTDAEGFMRKPNRKA